MGEWQINAQDVVEGVLGRDSYWRGGLQSYHAMWEGRRDELVDGWKRDLVAFTLKTGLDAVLVHTAYEDGPPMERPRQVGEGEWLDAAGNTLRHDPATDRIFLIKRGAEPTSAEPAQEQSPEPTESELEIVRHVVGELGKTHFIMSAPLIGHRKLSYTVAGGVDVDNEWWMQVYRDPDTFRDEFLADIDSVFDRGVVNAKREGIDGICFGFDFGFNQGPFVSPDHFRKAILPGLKARAEVVHRHGLFFLLHACGNNQQVMEMIVEAGFDAYQSIQPEEQPENYKRVYGDRITLWGGVPAGSLVLGTPEQVRRETEWALDKLGPGAGLILGTSHSVMPGATYENFMAMIETGQGFRYA